MYILNFYYFTDDDILTSFFSFEDIGEGFIVLSDSDFAGLDCVGNFICFRVSANTESEAIAIFHGDLESLSSIAIVNYVKN